MAEPDVGADISILWTTLTTFRLYQQAGFTGVRCAATHFELWPSDAVLFFDYAARGSVELHAPQGSGPLSPQESALHRLHAAEPQGMQFLRSEAQTRELHSLPGMRTLLWCEAGDGPEPSAYLVVSAASNRPGIVEGGGSHHGLRGLLCHALTNWQTLIGTQLNRSAAGDAGNVEWAPETLEQGDDVLQGTTGHSGDDELHEEIDEYLQKLQGTAILACGAPVDTALTAVLEEAVGARRHPMSGFGTENLMVRINQPAALLEALAAHGELSGPGPAEFSLEVRGDEAGGVRREGCRLRFRRGADGSYRVVPGDGAAAERAEVSVGQLTSLLFGSHIDRRRDTTGLGGELPPWAHGALRCAEPLYIYELDKS